MKYLSETLCACAILLIIQGLSPAIAKSTSTTAGPTTTTTAPQTTAPPINTTSTSVKPASSTTPPAKEPSQRFDAASFIGGIILCGGVIAIVFFGCKFYKARSERNYHTL
ncbi:sialomucin core protein 24-like isoform X2 [Lineus longissimus]|uniref:sialomucin core protein 24-like isoform X2 n=1 Tax=Lineus longissimus TaxID=88925 RepID=UPI00315D5587